MSKIFNSKNLLKLESQERYEAINPLETLIKTGLSGEDTMADIGCGTGFFAIPAAKLIGTNTLFACDISDIMLRFIEERAAKEGLKNVDPLLMDTLIIPIDNESASFTFCAFVIHEVPNFDKFINELIRITKPGGKIVILEWQITETPFGPPLDHRINSAEISKHFDESLVEKVQTEPIGNWFYAVTAQKKA